MTTPLDALSERRRLTFESLDGTRRIPLDNSTGWRALAGATGLEMPPVDVVTSPVPGAYGTALEDVRVGERPVFVPVMAKAATRIDHLTMLDALRDIIDPLRGEFRIVGITPRGERELVCVYTDGLKGSTGRDESGLFWQKLGVQATACQPFARARFDRAVEFRVSTGDAAFLGEFGETTAPWPNALSAGAVIGDGMIVQVNSEAPVHPVIELVGPMDSFHGTMRLQNQIPNPYTSSPPWTLSVPDGVPEGATLRLVTDPRARSIRMDGAPAAGRVARGSSLAPFYPGVSVMDAFAPGSTVASRVRISWRELHRSLW